MSNEAGAFIDKLGAAGHEDDSLYEVLELLQLHSSGVVTGRFMKTLAFKPAGSGIFMAELSNFALLRTILSRST